MHHSSSGAPGYLDWTEIDTAHFLGNFPESVDLYATQYDGVSLAYGSTVAAIFRLTLTYL